MVVSSAGASAGTRSKGDNSCRRIGTWRGAVMPIRTRPPMIATIVITMLSPMTISSHRLRESRTFSPPLLKHGFQNHSDKTLRVQKPSESNRFPARSAARSPSGGW